MVRHGADRQRPTIVLGRQGVERTGLHLDRQHAVVAQPRGQLRARGVERVAGVDQPDVGRDVELARQRGVVRGPQQPEVGHRGVVEPLEADPVHRGVGARPGREHEVAQREPLRQRPARADAHHHLHVVGREELAGIDRQRRLPHAGALHRDRSPAPGAGEAEHAAHPRVAHRVLEEGLGDPLGAQRVAGHQDLRRDGPGLGGEVRAHGRTVAAPS